MFVDLERDSTVADVRRAVGAGLRSVEHVKRYTSIGTGSEQGKLANVNAIRVAAELLCVDPGELGTTTFRPPYVAVSFALLAGRNRGPLFDPVRTTPIQPWHVAQGAVFAAALNTASLPLRSSAPPSPNAAASCSVSCSAGSGRPNRNPWPG